MRVTTRLMPAVLVVAMILLGACGASPTEEAAKSVFDACVNEEAKYDILKLEGDTVSIEVTGDVARMLASADDDAAESFARTQELSEAATNGIAVALEVVIYTDCLVEKTGYPGSSDQLHDGEKWEGWTYTEEPGAGSEFVSSFTATS